MLPRVSTTAILTLRARAEEHVRADPLFPDAEAADWFSRIAWPSELDRWWRSASGGRGLAYRAHDIDCIVAGCHARVDTLSVIELGAGLSTRRSRLSNLDFAHWTDVDFAEMVELRRSLGAEGEHIAASVLDHSWIDGLRGDPSHHLLIAEGLFYYLPRAKVEALLRQLQRRLSGAAIIFDVVGANDYALLLENTTSAGAPVAWHLDGDLCDALATFGLGKIGELDPECLINDANARYWYRLSPAQQAARYFEVNSDELRRGRSGIVLGRL